MKYIKEYREGDYCKGIYLCRSKQVLTAKTGKTYYSLTLQDKTGTVDAKMYLTLTAELMEFDAMVI